MINFIKENESFFLTIGYDYIVKKPLRVIPVSNDEALEMANNFTAEFAESISDNEFHWEYKNFKLTDAPEHPLSWLGYSRVKFYYLNQSWHMETREIKEIGRLVNRLLDLND